MAYATREARQHLLDTVAEAVDELPATPASVATRNGEATA